MGMGRRKRKGRSGEGVGGIRKLYWNSTADVVSAAQARSYLKTLKTHSFRLYQKAARGGERGRPRRRGEDAQHVVDVAEAPCLRGGAHGREARDGAGGHRGGPGQEAGGEGIRQGLRGAGPVPAAEEGRGAVPGLAEGRLRRQRQAAVRLLQLSEGMVRLLPVVPLGRLGGAPAAPSPLLPFLFFFSSTSVSRFRLCWAIFF